MCVPSLCTTWMHLCVCVCVYICILAHLSDSHSVWLWFSLSVAHTNMHLRIFARVIEHGEYYRPKPPYTDDVADGGLKYNPCGYLIMWPQLFMLYEWRFVQGPFGNAEVKINSSSICIRWILWPRFRLISTSIQLLFILLILIRPVVTITVL